MSPEVVARKLANISQYLAELTPYRNCPYQVFWADHYKIERIVELFVMAASDLVIRIYQPGEARLSCQRKS